MTRPAEDLIGRTHRVPVPYLGWEDTGAGALVDITINRTATGRTVEVFVAGVPPGYRAAINAVCRVVSAALQHGLPETRVVKMLRGLAEGSTPVTWGPGEGNRVASIPDAIGRLLAEELGIESVRERFPVRGCDHPDHDEDDAPLLRPQCRCGRDLDHSGPCKSFKPGGEL